MTREQFLLLKLAEECAEVAQRCSKSIQYGSKQVWKAGEVPGSRAAVPDEGLTNAQRLEGELKDLGLIVDLLCETDALRSDFYEDIDYGEWRTAKIAKLNKYLAYARSLGQIDGDWTI